MEKQIKSIDLIMENTEFIHIPTEAINSLYFEKANTIVALYDDHATHTKKTSISTEINNLIFNVNLDKLIKLTTVADHELFNVAYENKEYTVKALNELFERSDSVGFEVSYDDLSKETLFFKWSGESDYDNENHHYSKIDENTVQLEIKDEK